MVFFSIAVNLWDKNLNTESELSMDYFISSAKHRKIRNKVNLESVERYLGIVYFTSVL